MSEAVQPLTAPRQWMGPPQHFFNPTLLMFLASVAIATISTVGYFRWHWVDWCCFLLNVLALHMVGTVIHDACHNAAHRNRVINAILGHGSALMLGFSFPVFTRVHMQHHAHVNDPKNDPDHIVSTFGPLWLINARFFYHEIFFFQRRLWRKYELLEWFIGRALVALIVYLGVQYDFLGYIFNFWFVPLAVVGLALGLFFDYLPHRPFQERDRWLNARVYPSRILNLLIGGQNYHLVHHLWPTVPWYQYQAAYYHMKPLLDAKGCHQSLGLTASSQDFFGFLYDILLGIRFHRSHAVPESAAIGRSGDASTTAPGRTDGLETTVDADVAYPKAHEGGCGMESSKLVLPVASAFVGNGPKDAVLRETPLVDGSHVADVNMEEVRTKVGASSQS